MALLADRETKYDDISPPTDTGPRPERNPGEALPLHATSKGIAAAGSIPMPRHVWCKHVPDDMETTLRLAPNLDDTDDQALAVLAHRMHRDGLRICCNGRPTAILRAFPKPKLEEKGARMADFRLLNAMMGEPPRPFELPIMSQLAALLELLKAYNV